MSNKKLEIFLILIILLILIPLLKPWYIFSLDQVIDPNWWIPMIGSHLYWVWLLSQVFIFFHIPIWVLEKILILIIFILPIIWWYLLLKRLNNNYAILFWLLFLLFNPFFYDRFLDGQINIYLSYSLYPLFFYFLITLFQSFSIKKVIIVSLFSLLLCLTSIHNALFLFFIFLSFFLAYFKKIKIIDIIKLWSFVLIVNSIWIIPLFLINTNKFELINEINNFWYLHREAFQTLKGDVNIYFNTLSLHWYWGENQNRFLLNKSLNPRRYNLFIFIFLIILLWIISKIDIKNKKLNFYNFEYAFIFIWVISYIFSFWISSSNIFYDINQFMYNYFPFYKWMREPQKWIMFLVIIYAYFWSLWVKFLYDKLLKIYFINSFFKKIIFLIIIFTPIFYTPYIIWWFMWQVVIKNYPKEREEIKKYMQNVNSSECPYMVLKKSNGCYKAISFPWHGYIWIEWIGKVVWWWIVRYFWNNILYGDNIEIWNIYTQSTRPESKIIEKYIWPSWLFRKNKISDTELENFIKDLKWLWIKYIILLKEADWKYYKLILNILEKKWYIVLAKENKMVFLYKIIY